MRRVQPWVARGGHFMQIAARIEISKIPREHASCASGRRVTPPAREAGDKAGKRASN